VELLPLAEGRVTPVGVRGDNATHVSCWSLCPSPVSRPVVPARSLPDRRHLYERRSTSATTQDRCLEVSRANPVREHSLDILRVQFSIQAARRITARSVTNHFLMSSR